MIDLNNPESLELLLKINGIITTEDELSDFSENDSEFENEQ